MSDIPIKEVTIRVNPETHELVFMGADLDTDGLTGTELGLVKQGVIITDHMGQRAEIKDGHLRVDTSSGVPYNVNITGGDTYDVYTLVMVVPRECHYLHGYATTAAAGLSLNAGNSTHFIIPANNGLVFPGVVIAAGTAIYACNLSALSNFGALYLTVW
jgi:hypothetical protein